MIISTRLPPVNKVLKRGYDLDKIVRLSKEVERILAKERRENKENEGFCFNKPQ